MKNKRLISFVFECSKSRLFLLPRLSYKEGRGLGGGMVHSASSRKGDKRKRKKQSTKEYMINDKILSSYAVHTAAVCRVLLPPPNPLPPLRGRRGS